MASPAHEQAPRKKAVLRVDERYSRKRSVSGKSLKKKEESIFTELPIAGRSARPGRDGKRALAPMEPENADPERHPSWESGGNSERQGNEKRLNYRIETRMRFSSCSSRALGSRFVGV